MGKTRKLKKDRPFWPPKYYVGLTRKQKIQRKKEIQKHGKLHWKDPKAYVGFKTNKNVKTKPSKYTQEWDKLFPDAKSLEERSKVTGIPVDILRESYNRGLAAYRTGHRTGASQGAWGYARVSSLSLCGKTYYTADADLVEKAKERTASARRWWSRQCKKYHWTH